MDCSPRGSSSAHGIIRASIPEWAADLPCDSKDGIECFQPLNQAIVLCEGLCDLRMGLFSSYVTRTTSVDMDNFDFLLLYLAFIIIFL